MSGLRFVPYVIPAVGSGDPSEEKRAWIPASAGMTKKMRNDGKRTRKDGKRSAGKRTRNDRERTGDDEKRTGNNGKNCSLTEGTQKCGKGGVGKSAKNKKMEGRFYARTFAGSGIMAPHSRHTRFPDGWAFSL